MAKNCYISFMHVLLAYVLLILFSWICKLCRLSSSHPVSITSECC